MWLDQIRIIRKEKRFYFIVKDICALLEITNVTQAVRPLPEEWKSYCMLKTIRGYQELLVVTIDGLLKLVARSNHPDANKFQKSITSRTFLVKVEEKYKQNL